MAKEYIEKAAVREWFRPYGHTDEPISYEAITEFLDTEHAADVVEVVRCENCSFSYDGFICNGSGLMRAHMTLPNKYCADGVRRDNDATD